MSTMRAKLISLVFLLALSLGLTFQARSLPKILPSSTALQVFGNKKASTKRSEEEESKYWQGEWVCKDCGYIYNRVSNYFLTEV